MISSGESICSFLNYYIDVDLSALMSILNLSSGIGPMSIVKYTDYDKMFLYFSHLWFS